MDVVTKNRIKQLFQNSKINLIFAVAVGVVVIIVGYTLTMTLASGFFASLEGEQGTLAGNAQVVSDSSASGGKAIQFNAPATPPPPPPTGGKSCWPSSTDCRADWVVRCPAYPAFPDASCTGVPTGTALSNYTGPCTITTANTVIDSKTVNCQLLIRTTGVVIKKSKIIGGINADEDLTGQFVITDSDVDGGMGTKNFLALGVNVYHGAGPNVYCYTTCDIRDSWLHSPSFPTDGCGSTCLEAHLGAFLANDNGPDTGNRPCTMPDNSVINGMYSCVTLIHNKIHCDTPPSSQDGGCSGDVNLFGDFGKISYVNVDKNWLGGSTGISYCVYGGDSTTKPYPFADHVVFTNNIFQKGATGHCGAYGPVAGFGTSTSSNPGNVWTNNNYEDSTTVVSEN
jgi:hypothetical protein